MTKCENVKVSFERLMGAGPKEHKDIISKYDMQGYRYVGYIPISFREEGKKVEINLLFEKDTLS